MRFSKIIKVKEWNVWTFPGRAAWAVCRHWWKLLQNLNVASSSQPRLREGRWTAARSSFYLPAKRKCLLPADKYVLSLTSITVKNASFFITSLYFITLWSHKWKCQAVRCFWYLAFRIFSVWLTVSARRLNGVFWAKYLLCVSVYLSY